MRFSTDTFDRILYDYTVAIGDTITYNCNPYPYNVTTKCWVNAISSTVINGITYKVWQYYNAGGLDFYVIEGIGSTSGWQFPISNDPITFGSQAQLMCFYNNGTINSLSNSVPTFIVSFPSYNFNFDDSSSCLLSTGSVKNEDQNIEILPNPVEKNSNIVFPHVSSGYLIIYNMVGQIIFNVTLQNQVEFMIGDKIKIPGNYFYKFIEFENARTYCGEFTFQ